MLGEWYETKATDAPETSPGQKSCPAVTYAGGVGSFADLEELKQIGRGRVNVTIGSALDLFGGSMEFEKVVDFCRR